MKRFLLIALIFLSTLPLSANQKETPSPSEEKTSHRYKLGEVKFPYDPWETSLESSSPSFVSVVLTLGLVFFYRHGNIHFRSRNEHLQTDVILNESAAAEE